MKTPILCQLSTVVHEESADSNKVEEVAFILLDFVDLLLLPEISFSALRKSRSSSKWLFGLCDPWFGFESLQ